MMVKLRLFGYLRQFCSRETSKEFEFELPDRSTGKDLLALLGFPEKEDVILVINNVCNQERGKRLKENDEVLIYPYLGGG